MHIERRRCTDGITVITNKNSLPFDGNHCRVEPIRIKTEEGVTQPGFRVDFLKKSNNRFASDRNYDKNAKLKERRREAKKKNKDKRKRR